MFKKLIECNWQPGGYQKCRKTMQEQDFDPLYPLNETYSIIDHGWLLDNTDELHFYCM
jgi:hypothetical protein